MAACFLDKIEQLAIVQIQHATFEHVSFIHHAIVQAVCLEQIAQWLALCCI